MVVSNAALSITRIIPNILFLNTLAPLSSSITALIGIPILFWSCPFYSYIYGAIESGLLFGRTAFAFLVFIKAIFINLNQQFAIFEESSAILSVIQEITPFLLIPASIFGLFGAILFLIWAAILIISFWGKIFKSYFKMDMNNNVIAPENENNEENNDNSDEQRSNNGKKKARISNVYQSAVRMQFLHVTESLKKNLALFFTDCF